MKIKVLYSNKVDKLLSGSSKLKEKIGNKTEIIITRKKSKITLVA